MLTMRFDQDMANSALYFAVNHSKAEIEDMRTESLQTVISENVRELINDYWDRVLWIKD